MKQWYKLSGEEALKELKVTSDGLTSEQVVEIRGRVGENILLEAKKKSVLQVFAEQFKDLLVIILVIAAVISSLSGNLESTIVILAVILLNAILGTVQHEKAQKSLASFFSPGIWPVF